MSKEYDLKSKGYDPLVSKFVAMLENNRNRLLRMINEVTDEVMDYTPNSESIESIATILDHIAAVEWSWIFEDIDGKEMDFEEWKHAFALRKGSGLESQRKGMGKIYYIERLKKVRTQILQRLKKMNDNELVSLTKGADTDDLYTPEWILYHLINHEALHIGQISLLKRLAKENIDS